MAYATVAALRQKPYLDQVKDPDQGVLQTLLDEASAIIDAYLGYSFDVEAPEEAEQVVYGDGTDFLKPPAFVAGSVSEVTTLTGYTVPDYIEKDGYLVVTRTSIIGTVYGYTSLSGTHYHPYGGWQQGVPYTVTAEFGYNTAPAAIQHATKAIATRLWHDAQGGFSGVVGVEGAGVTRQAAIPALVKVILDKYAVSSSVGVW